MTMVQVAPRPVLSGDGRAGVVVSGGAAYLIWSDDEAIERLETPDEATIAALTPTASRCAVAGDDFLSLYQCGRPSRLLSTVRIDGPLPRMAVDDDLVVGIASDEDDRATLRAWGGSGLAGQRGSASLGPSAVDEVQVDGHRGRTLVWGLKGSRAQQGDGQFFVRIFELRGDDWPEVWHGEGAPRKPNGFLFPLADGAVGAYDERALTLLRPSPQPGGTWKPASTFRWGNLEQITRSPSGALVAWFWSDEDDDGADHGRARVADLSKGRIIQEVDIERLGEFSTLAVSDSGALTMAYGERPDRVVVCQVELGRLGQRRAIAIPSAAWKASR